MCLRGRSVLPSNASGWDYGRNGIGITAQYLNDWSPSGSIHFENVNVEGNGYRFFDADDSPVLGFAGIAFSTKGGGSDAKNANITNVTFGGANVITGNMKGIQFCDQGDTHGVQGANGSPVSLGVGHGGDRGCARGCARGGDRGSGQLLERPFLDGCRPGCTDRGGGYSPPARLGVAARRRSSSSGIKQRAK